MDLVAFMLQIFHSSEHVLESNVENIPFIQDSHAPLKLCLGSRTSDYLGLFRSIKLHTYEQTDIGVLVRLHGQLVTRD
jgi:hypothetical protein